MRVLVSDYVFKAEERQIIFTEPIPLERFEKIINETRGEVMYSFGDPLFGGEVAGSVLSLVYDTFGMEDTDKLLIFIEIESADLNNLFLGVMLKLSEQVDSNSVALAEVVSTLNIMNAAQGFPDQLGRMRVVPDGGSLSSITNINGFSGYGLLQIWHNLSNIPAQAQRQYVTLEP